MRAFIARALRTAAAVAAASLIAAAPSAYAGSCTAGFSTTPPIGGSTGGWSRCIGHPAPHVVVNCYSNVTGLDFRVSPAAESRKQGHREQRCNSQ